MVTYAYGDTLLQCEGTGVFIGQVSVNDAKVISDYGISGLNVDSNGNFVLVHLPGVFSIYIFAEGYYPQTLIEKCVYGGMVTDLGTITLTAIPPAPDPVNADLPQIAYISSGDHRVDQTFTYTCTLSDVGDGSDPSWSLKEAPMGMTINHTTGVISWIPYIGDIQAQVDVDVLVTNDTGSDTKAFHIDLIGPPTQGCIYGKCTDDDSDPRNMIMPDVEITVAPYDNQTNIICTTETDNQGNFCCIFDITLDSHDDPQEDYKVIATKTGYEDKDHNEHLMEDGGVWDASECSMGMRQE